MPTTRSSFLMHWIVPSAKGPLVSNRPRGAAALENALKKAPGLSKNEVGHPGQRFAVACGAVTKLGKQHRGTTELPMVNCPKCHAVAMRK